jgi:hypothetical protein
VTPLLPHRRNTTGTIVSTPKHTLVHIVEYLVELSLQEIEQPFGLIPTTPINPTITPPKSIHFDYQENSKSESKGSDSES